MLAKVLHVPGGMTERVRAMLADDPTLAWDDAVAAILKG